MTLASAVGPAHVTASDDTRRFHDEIFVFDALSIAYVLEDKYAERTLAGGVNATNVTFALEEDWDTVLRAFESNLAQIERSPYLRLCPTADDMLKAKAEGRLGVVIGTQGASMLEDRLWRLEVLTRMGLRILGLAYTTANAFGDGCGEKRDGGLTYLGEELIALVDGLPLMLDLSHCGHRTRAEAAALARAPVCTHSNAAAVRDNGRNTEDATVRALAAKGGVIGACGLPHSLAEGTPTLHDLLDHVDHLTRLVRVEHVGIGIDYVEKYQEQATVVAPPSVVQWRTRRPDIFGPLASFGRESYPTGIETVTKLPNLTQGLIDRGYGRDQVRAIMGGNWLDAFRRFCG